MYLLRFGKSLLSVLLLFVTLSLFAAYEGYTYNELLNLQNSLYSKYLSYKQKSDQFYSLAQTWRYKDGIAALSNYNLYMGQSIKYTGMAADVAAERAKLAKEISRRQNLTITSISISGPSNVTSSQSASYSCSIGYSDGSRSSVSPSWNVSNSSYAYFSGNTLYPKTAGAGKTITITASYNGKTASKTVLISKPVLASLSLSGPSSIKYCGTATFSCEARYTGSSNYTSVSPTWHVSNTNYAYFKGNVLTARIPGAGKTVTVSATYGGMTVKKSVKLLEPVKLYSLSIYGSASVKHCGSVTYRCVAKYTDNTTKDVTPSWSVSNKDYAYFKGGTNTFQARVPGGGKTVTITASYGGKKATKKIKISKPPTVYSLSLYGAASVKYCGSITYRCVAKYTDNTTRDVTPSWSVSNKEYAYFKGGTNTFQARIPGAGKTVTITASFGGKKATKKVKIAKSVTLYSLSLYGAATVKEASPVTYRCVAKYTDNTTKDISPSWSVSNTSYAYFSGNTLYVKAAGVGRSVTVTASFGGKKASKTVKLTASSAYISGSKLIQIGGATQYYYLYVDGKLCKSSDIVWSYSAPASVDLVGYKSSYYCYFWAYSSSASSSNVYISATYLGKTYKFPVIVYK